jgi:ATP-binding protein involved in chromosome partitioning
MMSQEVSEKDVHEALETVMHPEMDASLIELGMIKDVVVKRDKVIVTLALPFLGVPIRDYLVNITREAIMKLDIEADVKIAEMNREELQTFFATEREKWKR